VSQCLCRIVICPVGLITDFDFSQDSGDDPKTDNAMPIPTPIAS
jgi:hypothetical protein